MKQYLKEEYHSDIACFYGKPLEVFKKLVNTYSIESVFTNHDYEPYATNRDGIIKEFLLTKKYFFPNI
jgi:deoxyribodipyrimidine photo-lyase